MGLACAAFHWTPAQFWAATPHEWWASYEIYREMNGGKGGDGNRG
jgi:hypothetical protein